MSNSAFGDFVPMTVSGKGIPLAPHPTREVVHNPLCGVQKCLDYTLFHEQQRALLCLLHGRANPCIGTLSVVNARALSKLIFCRTKGLDCVSTPSDRPTRSAPTQSQYSCTHAGVSTSAGGFGQLKCIYLNICSIHHYAVEITYIHNIKLLCIKQLCPKITLKCLNAYHLMVYFQKSFDRSRCD